MVKNFPGYALLSDREKEVFELLCKVSPESIWGKAIENVCNTPDAYRFRKLVIDLKDQNEDCPDTMKAILGEAYQAVINF